MPLSRNDPILLRQLRAVLDFAFLGCLVLAVVLEAKALPLLVVFGLLASLLFWSRADWSNASTPLSRVVVPVGLYLGYSLFALVVHPGIGPDDPRPINPDAELYLGAAALLGIGLARGLQVSNISGKLRQLLPWGLLAAFAALTYYKFSQPTVCRISAEAAWPFIPALLFGTLCLLSFLGWAEFTRRDKLLRLCLVSLSIVVVIGYTGSRGVAVGVAFALSAIALGSLMPSLRGRLPSAIPLLGAVLLGVAMCAIVDYLTGCNSVSRLQTIFAPFSLAVRADDLPTASAMALASSEFTAALEQGAAGAADNSIGLRLRMWAATLDAISEAPLFGHGALSQQMFIAEPFGFEHAHNQYLTWLLTGGIVLLGIGLLFLSTPVLISAGLPTTDRLIIASATTGLWGGSMLFDSFLSLDFYIHYYCLLLGVLCALSNDIRKTAARRELRR